MICLRIRVATFYHLLFNLFSYIQLSLQHDCEQRHQQYSGCDLGKGRGVAFIPRAVAACSFHTSNVIAETIICTWCSGWHTLSHNCKKWGVIKWVLMHPDTEAVDQLWISMLANAIIVNWDAVVLCTRYYDSLLELSSLQQVSLAIRMSSFLLCTTERFRKKNSMERLIAQPADCSILPEVDEWW